ncbi:lipopolysaccharide biosynthesis protein [Nonomuraea roseoviolacea]|uniref:O-antigen/teichoic acid export membrane protein n=1 Tax=Nonomuraea roseoviolacea subsp. carminata TaxID=160689 RepID=A0ABT1K578_9ACTN|nr:polysaccharide biosynthesis C-terminal domain-containing protein [Nonomuraea roseoviolacea]MCP2349166.1 O-antigen/teichoic acid export membrane protein [Nonomuraea roseoviolacea subsp. carminata]
MAVRTLVRGASSAAVAFRTLATRAVRLAMETVTGVIIARVLQPEGRGVYAVVITVASAAIVVGHMSLEKSQITFWSDRSRQRPLATNGLILGLGLGALAALGALACVMVGGAPGGWALWALALSAIPFGAAAVNLNGILTLRARMDAVNRASLLAAAVWCLAVLALAVTGRLTVGSVLACWAVSIALPCAVLVPAGVRPFTLRPDSSLARRQLRLSSRYHLGWVAFNLLITVDVPLLGALDAPAAAGVYTVAVTILGLTRIPCETITQVVLPQQAACGVEDAKHVTARALRLILLVSFACVAGLALVAPVLIPLVYGESFAGSVAPLLVLAPGTAALMMVRPLEQHLVRVAHPLAMTVVSAGALTANVLLNLVTIPRWGAVGAAMASTLTYTALAAVQALRFSRATGMPLSAFVPRVADVRAMVACLPLKKVAVS